MGIFVCLIVFVRERERYLWCFMPLSTIFQLYRGSQFFGGGNRSNQIKPPICHKSLTNIITYCCLIVCMVNQQSSKHVWRLRFNIVNYFSQLQHTFLLLKPIMRHDVQHKIQHNIARPSRRITIRIHTKESSEMDFRSESALHKSLLKFIAYVNVLKLVLLRTLYFPLAGHFPL